MRLVNRFLSCAAVLVLCSYASAASFSYTGNFISDNDLQKFSFTLPSPTTVTMQTWSFAGGTNAASVVIPAGGFAPVLALFDSTGTIVGNIDQGGVAPNNCGPRNLDSGLCLDAFLSESLGAGSYTLVLSQQDNVPLGQLLTDGYQHDGEPNFAGGFNDFGLQRNSSWAVDIVIQDTTTTPEPATGLALSGGLAWLACTGLRRKSKG